MAPQALSEPDWPFGPSLKTSNLATRILPFHPALIHRPFVQNSISPILKIPVCSNKLTNISILERREECDLALISAGKWNSSANLTKWTFTKFHLQSTSSLGFSRKRPWAIFFGTEKRRLVWKISARLTFFEGYENAWQDISAYLKLLIF